MDHVVSLYRVYLWSDDLRRGTSFVRKFRISVQDGRKAICSYGAHSSR